MRKKKICMMYNHFQLQDGVNRSAMAIANELAKRNDVEITLIPIFKFDKECFRYLDKQVVVKPVFRTYFRGFTKIVSKIPSKLMYNIWISDKYDVNIAFQYGQSMRIVSSGVNTKHKSIAWMHCYDEGLLYKREYEKIGNVVCVSQCNAGRLRKELPTINVDYNYNPIDNNSVREQGRQPIPQQRPVCTLFVSVARMSPEKGYDNLLQCVSRLKQDGYIFHLWLVGDGPILRNLIEKAKKLQIEKFVTFWGQQLNPHAFVSKADVYICSSTVEGYSTASTEAIMQEVPVLTTNCSGGEEMIKESECGLLFGMDEESIYSAMKSVLDNPTIINDWKQTLKVTRERFSPNYRFKRFLKIVELE